MKYLMTHLLDRTDADHWLDLSPGWQPMSLQDYFIDMRSKTRSLPGDDEPRLARLKSALPVELCQWAIGLYQESASGKGKDDIEWFMRCADLLVETQEREGRFAGCWLYRTPSPYRTSPPWPSAMAQGEALSVLVRAHALAPSSGNYEDAAALALRPFHLPVAEGGVVSGATCGGICLEEYPSCPPSHVLNGWIFSWMGVKEYAAAFNDHGAQSVAQRSLDGLLGLLPAYDTGYWSRYDLFPGFAISFLANRFYHRLHIAQLRAMYKATGAEPFAHYAERWISYMARGSCRIRSSLHRLCYKAYCWATGWR